MQEWETEKFAAAVEFGEHTGSVRDLINLAQNLDCFEFYAGIEDEEDLGRFYIEEICTLGIPKHLENYIDYEAYGGDMSMDDNGRFVDGGYIVENGDSFTEHYKGKDDLPEEHRIFAYPAPEKSIQKMLAEYRQTISDAPAHERPLLTDVER